MITTHNTVTRSTVTRLQGGALLLGLAALTSLVGCPGEEPGSSTTEDMTSMPSDDMFTDTGNDSDMEMPDSSIMIPDMNEMTCTPATECPADTCGMVSDGCGGTIQCEPCACEAGVPSALTCGTCQIGASRCEGEEIRCDMPALDELEISNCAATLVYVDSGYSGFSSGSELEPFKSLGDAFAEVGDDMRIKAYLLKEGTYNESSLVLPDGVSIIGGFGDGWVYQPDTKSIVHMTASTDQRAYGILIEGNTTPMALEGLDLRITEIPTGGGTDYVTPLEVRQSEYVTLRHMDTLSMDALAGYPGEPGLDGANGVNGGDADSRGTDPTTLIQPGLALDAPEACLGAQGGNGGRGGSATNSTIGPQNGDNPLMGPRVGGDRGTEAQPPGDNGASGFTAAGVVNPAPEPPTGDLRFFPLVPSGELSFEHDRDGVQGDNGLDGGGGTGGGGGYRYTSSGGSNPGTTYSGGSGGAGGSGGCGGEGGQGGQGGASSFGLVLVSSPSVVLEDATFEARRGGNGAPGGFGGEGGRGGSGGNGTQSPASNRGGNGGDGGRGQNGANGAPGAGGYSVGILCSHVHESSLESVTAIGSTPGQGAQDLTSSLTAPNGQTLQMSGCQ